MDDSQKEPFSELWQSQPDFVIATTSSRLAFFETHVEKYRLNRKGVDPRQSKKAEKLLILQKVGYKKHSAVSESGPVEVISMRRFEHSDCAAAQYTSLDHHNIKQIQRSIERLLKKCDLVAFDELSFKLGVFENINRQRQWAEQNLPELLQRRLDDFFMNASSVVDDFLASYHQVSVPLIHGDLHLGNVFLRGHRTYILDPAENDIRFCLAPPWLEYASLAASLVLLGREELVDEFVKAVREDHSDFDISLFNLLTGLKILVRLRFEETFLALNKDIPDQGLVQWRREVVDKGPDRLGLWLNGSANLPTEGAPVTALTPKTIEALRLSNQVIESRRNELNAKSNVYVAVSIALVAGNIAILDKNSQSLTIANLLLLLSAGISLFSAWRFLDLVRTLTGRSRAPKSRGRLLFFGWWAKSNAADVGRKINYIDESTLANELAVQNISLARNIRFRYTAQTAASKALGAAFLVFFIGIAVQVLGLGADTVKLPWGISGSGSSVTNAPATSRVGAPAPPASNTAQGNVP